MSKIIQIADRLGKSPAAVYKMIDGTRPAKPEECAILTEELGQEAGAAYDIQAVNSRLKAENERLVLSNIELTADNQRHVKGLKISMIGAACFIVACLALVAIAYRPIIKDRWVNAAYHDEIKDARIESLEREVETLKTALAGTLGWNDLIVNYGKETKEKIEEAVGE